MEFTEEIFIKNFIKDKKILGEDAKYIYEEIFSSILNENISLDDFEEELNNNYYSFERVVMRDAESQKGLPLTEEEEDNIREKIISEIYGPITQDEALKNSNIFGKITPKLGFFTRLKNKLGTLFASLKGKSFKEILSGGLGWLKDPANFTKIMGTAGGAALILMIMRALKTRKKLKDYKRLQQMAIARGLREEYSDEFGWGDPSGIAFAKSKNELVNECKKNKDLERAVFIGNRKIIENNYFDY